MPVSPSRTPLAGARARGATALLIVDMISTWRFADADKLAPGATRIAPRIAALKARCVASGVPAIYVNDNLGRWRSDFRQLVETSVAAGAAGATIAALLAPAAGDYSVLKPKHSAFFATPLDLLLRHLRVAHVLLTGVAADQCILLSAAEAAMRDYRVTVPADCVAAQTPARRGRAVRQLQEALGVATTASARIRLPRARSGR